MVLVVSPRELVDPTAAIVAEPFLHLLTPDAVLQLARDAVVAWSRIRAQAGGMDDTDAADVVAAQLAEQHLLLSDLRARLLATPIHG